MCRYINGEQWNTGSIFVKPSSVDIWKLIIEFMKENKTHPAVDNKGDENIVNMVYHLYPDIKSRFTLLNNQYNVGCTQFDMRYDSATKPVYVGAFKPDEPKNINKFIGKDLLSREILDIFKENKISC